MENWKDNLFNKNDYNWTDKEFDNWKVENKKHIKHFVNGMADHKRGIRSISDIMYAHRMDKLKLENLPLIEQSKKANDLWKEHLKRIGSSSHTH